MLNWLLHCSMSFTSESLLSKTKAISQVSRLHEVTATSRSVFMLFSNFIAFAWRSCDAKTRCTDICSVTIVFKELMFCCLRHPVLLQIAWTEWLCISWMWEVAQCWLSWLMNDSTFRTADLSDVWPSSLSVLIRQLLFTEATCSRFLRDCGHWKAGWSPANLCSLDPKRIELESTRYFLAPTEKYLANITFNFPSTLYPLCLEYWISHPIDGI